MAKVAIVPTKKPIKGVPPGAVVTVSGAHARALVAVGAARYPTPDEVTPPAPPASQPKPEPPAKSKRTYRRRDMKAED
jgi:hypothetical protein